MQKILMKSFIRATGAAWILAGATIIPLGFCLAFGNIEVHPENIKNKKTGVSV